LEEGRCTRFLFLRKLEEDNNADGMLRAMLEILFPYRLDVQTTALDNGTEFARHEELSEKLGRGFYFVHPYSSGQETMCRCGQRLIFGRLPVHHS